MVFGQHCSWRHAHASCRLLSVEYFAGNGFTSFPSLRERAVAALSCSLPRAPCLPAVAGLGGTNATSRRALLFNQPPTLTLATLTT